MTKNKGFYSYYLCMILFSPCNTTFFFGFQSIRFFSGSGCVHEFFGTGMLWHFFSNHQPLSQNYNSPKFNCSTVPKVQLILFKMTINTCFVCCVKGNDSLANLRRLAEKFPPGKTTLEVTMVKGK